MGTSVIALIVIIVMTSVGVVFGFVLAFANKKFAVESNPLIHIVEDVLPKGQCGACGYPGCQGYAEAVVLDPDVSPNLCIPGKAAVAKMVADLTGKVAPEIAPRVAHVKCAGNKNMAHLKYEYQGVQDCVAASLVMGGPKMCSHGCLGFGTCVKNCPFDAMTMGEDGLPIVDQSKCTGCAKCEAVCPKKVMEMVPMGAHVSVNCNSRDKGPVARKVCGISCIGCGLCSRNCPHGAIKVENFLAKVDSNICKEKCTESTCFSKCPTNAITDLIGCEKEKLPHQDIAS